MARRQSFTQIFRSRASVAGRWLNQARDAMAAWVDMATGNRDRVERNRFLRAFHEQSNAPRGRGASTAAITNVASKAETVGKTNISKTNIGGLYLFIYKAKWRDKLPYWDRYPLIFLISNNAMIKGKPSNDHFLGLNLHYLYPRQRALLMDAINDRLMRNGFDETHQNYDPNLYSRITYEVLKGAASHRQFKPAIKMYRKDHVVSPNLIKIPGFEWENVIFLDIARFEKKSEAFVHAESARNS